MSPWGNIGWCPTSFRRPINSRSATEGVKVTISLSKRSADFFKLHAARNQAQYQRMIRQLLDAYVDAYKQPPARRPAGATRK